MLLKRLILTFVLLCTFFSSSLHAQFVDFGRNKVQYSDFNWYVLNTEHFQVHYYKQEKELAEQGAFFAEESYKLLQQKFRHSLVDSVPLIFYASPSHFKQTNTTPGLIPDGVGGFFEFIKGRVVLPHDGSINNFKHVIRHELVHVFTTSKVGAELKIHAQVSDRMPPLWFVEGLAEYWSTEWDYTAEMVLKDAVLNNYIVGLSDWENIYGTFLMYKLGQKALQYISDTYGEEKILQLMENFWYDENFENVMKFTIGKNYKEFDKEFLYYLKKLYYPQITSMDNPSQVTTNIFSDGFAHKPAYIKNGIDEEIYFIGNRTGYTSLYKINIKEKSKPELVLKGETSDDYEQFHFFRTGIDISDKKQLVFATQKGESDALYLLDINTGNVVKNFSFKEIVNIGSPVWSRDSRFIAFSGTEVTGKVDLYLFDIEKETLRRLTNDFYDDREPGFSPDGRFIVFSSDRTSYGKNNRYNLFLYDLQTNKINYLTDGNQVDFSPSFSQDGNKIVYTSTDMGAQNLWMIDSVFGSNPKSRRITSFTTAAFDPRWCGEDKIVFSAFEDGMITIRMVDSVSKKYEHSNISQDINQRFQKDDWASGKIITKENINDLKYEKKFSFDIATTGLTVDPVFGTFAGGALSISDMLGNEKYYILLYNNSNYESSFWESFNIAISKISLEKRLNYAYGVFHLSGRRYDYAESDFAYFERMYGGYLSFSYPLSFFRRIETTTSFAQSEKDIDFLDNRRSLLLTNSISYVKDNSLWTYTGPIDGERYNVTLGYTTDIENSNENFYSLMFDYRKYFRLSRPTALALRGQFFVNEGKKARRYLLGGSWSLRGWPWISMKGTKLWQANAELRFPLINEISIRFPLGIDFDFPGIRGALFFDAGNCWDNGSNYFSTKGSIGAGVRINVFGLVALRYDLGKRIEDNFKRFQGGLFHQVFFGWDF